MAYNPQHQQFFFRVAFRPKDVPDALQMLPNAAQDFGAELLCDIMYRGGSTERMLADIDLVLGAGANIDGDKHHIPLIVATRAIFTNDEKYRPVLKHLLDKGANPNVYDTSSRTPAFFAAFGEGSRDYPNPSVLELLIAKGADVNHTVSNGDSLYDVYLHFAHDKTLSSSYRQRLNEAGKILRQNGATATKLHNNRQSKKRPQEEDMTVALSNILRRQHD